MGKKKTTQKETSKVVQTPTNPSWVEQPMQSLTGRISGLQSLDPTSFVAPLSQRETDAFAGVDQLGIDDDWFNRTLNADAPQVASASLLDGLENYMSPYTGQVVDAALADFDFGAGQTRAQQDLEMAGAGAFGGSGAALTRSMTEDALTRGRASTSANLRDQAFMRGTALSSEDAARRQAASTANAGLMLQDRGQKADLMFARNNDQRSNLAMQAQAGATEREIDQARRAAPLTALQAEAGLLAGLPLSMFSGQVQDKTGTTTSTQSGGMLGQLGTLAMGLGSLGLAPFTGGASLLGTLGMGGAMAGQAAKNWAAFGGAGGIGG